MARVKRSGRLTWQRFLCGWRTGHNVRFHFGDWRRCYLCGRTWCGGNLSDGFGLDV